MALGFRPLAGAPLAARAAVSATAAPAFQVDVFQADAYQFYPVRISLPASIAATDSSDTCAVTAARWRTAQIAAQESSDTVAVATSVTTGAEIRVDHRNLLTYTESFANAIWVPTHASVSADVTTAPDGTATADKLVGDASTNRHYVSYDINLSVSTTYSMSVFAKAAEKTWIAIEFITRDGVRKIAYFDLINGVVGNVTSGYTGAISSFGNGWYRGSITGLSGTGASPSCQMLVELADSNGVITFLGNGSDGAYIWGAQLESGALTGYQQVLGATNTNGEGSDTAAIATSQTISGAIAAVETQDSAAITAANWRTAQIAAVETKDAAAIATTVTTGAAIAAVETKDSAAITAANWRTAQIVAQESTDTAAVTAANWRTAQIVAIEITDSAAIVGRVTTGAAISVVESTDTAAITAARWRTAQIAAVESTDTAALSVSVTTGAAIAAVETKDTAAITAARWRTAQIAAVESSDTAAVTTVVTRGATIAAGESSDTVSIAALATISASIAAVESRDQVNIEVPIAAEPVVIGGGPPAPRPPPPMVLFARARTGQGGQSVASKARMRMVAAAQTGRKPVIFIIPVMTSATSAQGSQSSSSEAQLSVMAVSDTRQDDVPLSLVSVTEQPRQTARAYARLTLVTSVRSGNVMQGSAMKLTEKAGEEIESVTPHYDGDSLPDIFKAA